MNEPLFEIDPREIFRFLFDMAGFASYRSDVRTLIVLACLCLTAMSVMLMTAISFRLRDRARMRKLGYYDEPENALLHEYGFSDEGVLKIYERGCSVYIGDTSVSGMLDGILRMGYRGPDDNRILIAVCEDKGRGYPGDNIVREIRCGELDEKKCRELIRIMLQYAGG